MTTNKSMPVTPSFLMTFLQTCILPLGHTRHALFLSSDPSWFRCRMCRKDAECCLGDYLQVPKEIILWINTHCFLFVMTEIKLHSAEFILVVIIFLFGAILFWYSLCFTDWLAMNVTSMMTVWVAVRVLSSVITSELTSVTLRQLSVLHSLPFPYDNIWFHPLMIA